MFIKFVCDWQLYTFFSTITIVIIIIIFFFYHFKKRREIESNVLFMLISVCFFVDIFLLHSKCSDSVCERFDNRIAFFILRQLFYWYSKWFCFFFFYFSFLLTFLLTKNCNFIYMFCVFSLFLLTGRRYFNFIIKTKEIKKKKIVIDSHRSTFIHDNVLNLFVCLTRSMTIKYNTGTTNIIFRAKCMPINIRLFIFDFFFFLKHSIIPFTFKL